MKKERKEDSFIKQPFYQGGNAALNSFISRHLKYPEVSQKNKVEGDVHLRYDINIQGNVTDVKVIGGLDDACNNEAIRVIKLLKFVVPKNPRHLKITFHKNITIHFRIHEAKNTNPEFPVVTPIQYHITSSVSLPKTTVEPNPKNVVYTYTINLK